MKLILAVVIAACSYLQVVSAETNVPPAQEITGAFGVKFGTIVNLAQYTIRSKSVTGIPLYSFTPKRPLTGLTQYYFKAMPKTGQIYSIWAIGEYDNNLLCQKQQAMLLDLLKMKYGESEKQDVLGSLSDDMHTLHRGSKTILLKRTDLGRVLYLTYTDDDLEKLAEKDHIEPGGQKVDGSGL